MEPEPRHHPLPQAIGDHAACPLNFHVPAPGIEPGTTALSERCTTVVLDGGTGTGRIIRFSEPCLRVTLHVLCRYPRAVYMSRQPRMPFLLQLPVAFYSNVDRAGLEPAIS